MYLKLLVCHAVLLAWSVTCFSQPTLSLFNLKCGNKINPLGITSQHPDFSWQITSNNRNCMQKAYRIIVSDSWQLAQKNEGNIWDSKKVASDNSIGVTYFGKSFVTLKKYFWKVKIWDNTNTESDWSETASFTSGLFSATDWGNAHWIGYDDMPESMRIVPGVHGSGDNLGHMGILQPVIPMLRNDFEVRGDVASAILCITGLGQYEAYINGKKIGNSFLSPGWTNYDKSVLYNTFDVTSNISPGMNTLGAIVGTGFYNINRERYRKLVIAYGNPKLICKLHIVYTNGETEDFDSNSSWKTAPSPVTYSSMYGGENYDARLEQPNWNKPAFDASCWKNAETVTPPNGLLVSESDYPVTIKNKLEVKNKFNLAPGKHVYDFGQNTAGIPEIKLKGKKGQVVRLIPAELLTKTNEANQTATGRWHYYTYTLNGDSIETWHPMFTYYGFRYLQIEGADPGKADEKNEFAQLLGVNLLQITNSAPKNGSFTCSNDLFNRIVPLINQAVESNMVSVLTDCPHREKLGWLEQTFLMGASLNYNYEIVNLYRKIVMDMMDAQTADGLVPDIAPEYVMFDDGFRDSPEWGSAIVILPYLLYKWYGDTRTMELAWPAIIKYINYLEKKSDQNILTHGLGDWFDMGPQKPGFSQLTPTGVTATAIYYYDLKIAAEIAELLQKKPEQQRFSTLAAKVKDAYNTKFFNSKTCIYATGSQTAMAMPLSLGIANPAHKDKVVANLVNSINKNNNALTAGDIGFHYLIDALTQNGQSQLVFEMNNRDDVPGYGYQLKKGATALTESWKALEVVSNNHFMLGHIMEWFYSGIGGIQQTESSVAFKHIVIKPSVVGDLKHATASFNSPYGTIVSHWEKTADKLSLDITIPANTDALVYIPVTSGKNVFEQGKNVTQFPQIKWVKNEANCEVYSMGSGDYHFEIK